MSMQARTRVDAWGISLGTPEAAATQEWHPLLAGYARGVQAMMDRDLNKDPTPTSWMWAAHTHAFPDGVTRLSRTWMTCKHSSPFFLPWHRGYLVWFERIIQDAIRDDSWALPYWDYTGPDKDRLQPPPEFSVPEYMVDGLPTANPLFVDGRGAVDPESLEGAYGSINTAMAQYRYARKNGLIGFGGGEREPERGPTAVESSPHNNVHGDVGNGGLLSYPTTAAQDPLFWFHHSNIDRLWVLWRDLDGSLDADRPGGLAGEVEVDWPNREFGFGGDRSATKFRARDMTDLQHPDLNYSYEHTAYPAERVATIMGLRAELLRKDQESGAMGVGEIDPDDQWTLAGASATPFQVGDAGASVEVPLENMQLNLTGDATLPSGLGIRLEGLRASARPHLRYRVRVAVTDGGAARDLGGFSTFGIGDAQEFPVNLLFDASDLIGQLVTDGWSGGPLIVQVTPDVDAAAAPAGGAQAALEIEQVTVTQRP